MTSGVAVTTQPDGPGLVASKPTSEGTSTPSIAWFRKQEILPRDTRTKLMETAGRGRTDPRLTRSPASSSSQADGAPQGRGWAGASVQWGRVHPGETHGAALGVDSGGHSSGWDGKPWVVCVYHRGFKNVHRRRFMIRWGRLTVCLK